MGVLFFFSSDLTIRSLWEVIRPEGPKQEGIVCFSTADCPGGLSCYKQDILKECTSDSDCSENLTCYRQALYQGDGKGFTYEKTGLCARGEQLPKEKIGRCYEERMMGIPTPPEQEPGPQ